MKLQEIRNHIKEQLATCYSASEAGEIGIILMEWALETDRSFIVNNPKIEISEQVEMLISTAIDRLLNNEPIQYITGEAYFYKRKFEVNNAVLIPRPETEELVELVLKYIKKEEKISVIDIGTGSGCIPISIKLERPDARVFSVDLSSAALDIAALNAKNLLASIELKQLDFLQTELWKQLDKFDVIVSNPPYIPLNEKSIMAKHVVEFEPNMALFVEDDSPFIFYQAIANFAENHLQENGKVFLEIPQDYAKEVAEIFKQKNYETSIIKDISGNDRIVTATRFR